MNFVRSHFGKMNLWQVEHFFQHICHHFWVGLLGVIAKTPKSDDKHVEKSVQLVRSFQNDLLQNPYFSQFHDFFLNLIFGGFCYLAQRAAQWMTDCNVREWLIWFWPCKCFISFQSASKKGCLWNIHLSNSKNFGVSK